MSRQPVGAGELQLRRCFDASRERVFSAWTEPKQLEQWWAPPGFRMGIADIDVRAGGCFRIGMIAPDGTRVFAVGMLEDVARPGLLVFLWEWEGWDPAGPEAMGITRVTVEFHERGAKTEVVLTQSGFPSEEVARLHEQGWRECLERIDRLVA